MNKVIQDISLCKRAGKIIMGFDVVKESLINQTAELLVVANDVSPKTMKEVNFLSTKYGVELIVIEATLDELWYILGKRVGVLAITDKGLGEKIRKDVIIPITQVSNLEEENL